MVTRAGGARGAFPAAAGLSAAVVLVFGLWGNGYGKEVLPEPAFGNTFYLFMGDGYRGSVEGETPYAEGWPLGGLPYNLQVAKLQEMIARIGPDGPYLRLGIGEALWPTETVDPEDDWNYQGLVGLGQTRQAQEADARVPKGPDPYFNAVIMRSWAEVGMPGIIIVNSGNLVRQAWQSVSDTQAVPRNLTAYLEQFPDMVQRYDDGRISISDDGDGIHEPRDYVEGESWNGNAELGTMLSFSRLVPDSLMEYWNRNMRAAMDHILRINQLYPGLIVAVSIEAENDLNHIRCLQGDCGRYADFSPKAIEEWRQWLSHTGIYGPGGAFEGQGADPWFPTVFNFNAATGSSFSSWAEVDPRSPKAGPEVWDMYLDGGDGDGEWSPNGVAGSGHVQGWCERMVEHRCEDSVNLLWSVASSAGWSRDQVFTHQVPGGFVDAALDPGDVPYWGYGHRLCTLASCAVENGRPGITGFRVTTVNLSLMEALQSLSPDGAWANLEFNPIKTEFCPGYANDYELWSSAYRLNWEKGAHVLCAFRWWVPPEASTWWANIRPDFHRPPPPDGTGDPSIDFEARLRATHQFVSDPNLRFRPWSPTASLTDPLDYLPPPPRLGALAYDPIGQVISFEIDRRIYPTSRRLLWHDPQEYPQWPGMTNVFGWPEFSNGHFHVYRDTVPSFDPSPSNLMEVLPAHVSSVRDSTPPDAAAVFYAVVAVDNGGDQSDPARIWVAPQLVTVDSLVVRLLQNTQYDTTVGLLNAGLRPLRIDSAATTVPWLALGKYPRLIPPGGGESMQVGLVPGSLTPGVYSGQIAISSNDPFAPEKLVRVVMTLDAVGAEQAPVPGALTVMPQPASQRAVLMWHLGRADRAVSLEILDVAGRVVYAAESQTDASGVCTIHLDVAGSLPSGVYLARLSADEAVVRRRIVVLH